MMRSGKLLKVFGEIDEKYIMEAETKMKYKKKFYKKPITLAAVLVLCVSVSGVIAIAKTGMLEGYFKDIIGKGGAAVGTSYENTTNEVNINIVEADDKLIAQVEMLYPDQVPYSELEEFGIESYKIVDEKGRIIKKGSVSMERIENRKVLFNIPLDGIPKGNYKLIVSKMVGGKKADQPLSIGIDWECEFTKE